LGYGWDRRQNGLIGQAAGSANPGADHKLGPLAQIEHPNEFRSTLYAKCSVNKADFVFDMAVVEMGIKHRSNQSLRSQAVHKAYDDGDTPCVDGNKKRHLMIQAGGRRNQKRTIIGWAMENVGFEKSGCHIPSGGQSSRVMVYKGKGFVDARCPLLHGLVSRE